MKKYKIEDDTSIVSIIVADVIVNEVGTFIAKKHKEMTDEYYKKENEMIAFLTKYQEGIYQNNSQWRKDMQSKGVRGRDMLYCFMRHWLSSWLLNNMKSIYRTLPDSFKMGHELKGL